MLLAWVGLETLGILVGLGWESPRILRAEPGWESSGILVAGLGWRSLRMLLARPGWESSWILLAGLGWESPRPHLWGHRDAPGISLGISQPPFPGTLIRAQPPFPGDPQGHLPAPAPART